jgi:hypothetical protein
MEEQIKLPKLSSLSNEHLYLVLQTSRDELYQNYLLRGKIIGLERKISDLDVSYTGCVMGFLCFIAFIITTSVLYGVVLFDYLKYNTFLSIAFIGIIPLALSIFIGRRIHNPRKAKKKKQQEELKKKQDKLRQQYQENEENMRASWLIPDDYREYEIIATMLGYMDSGRASSWERVTDLFETDVKHGETMRELHTQTKIAEDTRDAAQSAARSARSAAAGNWATAAGIWLK